MEEKMRRARALVARASYDEKTAGYRMDAADWEELRVLVASAAPSQEGKAVPSGGHSFTADEKCSGCGMTERYFEQALAILRGWPEDSEKDERIAELTACKKG